MRADQPVKKTSKLSSAIFGTFLFRCCSFPYGVCLLVHSRLYYRINVHFFVLNLINSIICYVFFKPVVKATMFQWTLEHDVAMRSPERG